MGENVKNVMEDINNLEGANKSSEDEDSEDDNDVTVE